MHVQTAIFFKYIVFKSNMLAKTYFYILYFVYFFKNAIYFKNRCDTKMCDTLLRNFSHFFDVLLMC